MSAISLFRATVHVHLENGDEEVIQHDVTARSAGEAREKVSTIWSTFICRGCDAYMTAPNSSVNISRVRRIGSGR